MSQNATRRFAAAEVTLLDHTWDELAEVHLAQRPSAAPVERSVSEREELAVLVDAQAAMSWNMHAQLFG